MKLFLYKCADYFGIIQILNGSIDGKNIEKDM